MTKTLRSFALLAFTVMLAAFLVGQAIPVQTSLSVSVVNNTQNTVYPASLTSFVAGNYMFIDGELMLIKSVNTASTSVTVQRAQSGTMATPHTSGTMVLEGVGAIFQTYDPVGNCIAANTIAQPWINVRNGYQWLCSTVTNSWVPGFGNPNESGTTAAVASVAGLITPSGPMFHITGALAITGFNVPVGFNKGQMCVIPDGAFTTTTANNIAAASTAVVSRVLCWQYDPNTAKFYPFY